MIYHWRYICIYVILVNRKLHEHCKLFFVIANVWNSHILVHISHCNCRTSASNSLCNCRILLCTPYIFLAICVTQSYHIAYNLAHTTTFIYYRNTITVHSFFFAVPSVIYYKLCLHNLSWNTLAHLIRFIYRCRQFDSTITYFFLWFRSIYLIGINYCHQ